MSDALAIGLALWFVGFLAIQLLVRWSLRGEPTAHGQIVGRQIGCIVGLLWPIVLPWVALVGTGAGIVWIYRKAAERMRS